MTNFEVSYLLSALVGDESRCMALLVALDKAARDACPGEYGLPLYDPAQCALLREVIYRWVVKSHPTPLTS